MTLSLKVPSFCGVLLIERQRLSVNCEPYIITFFFFWCESNQVCFCPVIRRYRVQTCDVQKNPLGSFCCVFRIIYSNCFMSIVNWCMIINCHPLGISESSSVDVEMDLSSVGPRLLIFAC